MPISRREPLPTPSLCNLSILIPIGYLQIRGRRTIRRNFAKTWKDDIGETVDLGRRRCMVPIWKVRTRWNRFFHPVSQVSLSTGSLFTDKSKAWNVAHLPSFLNRLLPSSSNGLPGVNTPYLYFGMWRATFAWHVEDMDLFSINYIHFGAGKFWYAVPQARASALEQTMRGEPWENKTSSHLLLTLPLQDISQSPLGVRSSSGTRVISRRP